jgi:hypothetical protein
MRTAAALGRADPRYAGEAFFEYTKTIAIHKKSCLQELSYNRYLEAFGLPPLKLRESDGLLQLLVLP